MSCYDGAGKYEPCVTRANMSPSQFNSRTIELPQSVSWTTTALYQQAIWPSNRSGGKLDNKSGRSSTKFHNKRANRIAQQRVGKTPIPLRATFDTMFLLRFTQAAYAYCICCRGAGSPRQGTPLADRRLLRSAESSSPLWVKSRHPEDKRRWAFPPKPDIKRATDIFASCPRRTSRLVPALVARRLLGGLIGRLAGRFHFEDQIFARADQDQPLPRSGFAFLALQNFRAMPRCNDLHLSVLQGSFRVD
jgi:hypothetical protein